jgi:hypothetical protein
MTDLQREPSVNRHYPRTTKSNSFGVRLHGDSLLRNLNEHSVGYFPLRLPQARRLLLQILKVSPRSHFTNHTDHGVGVGVGTSYTSTNAVPVVLLSPET